EEVCAKDPKDMGKVMGAVMVKVKGRADGKVVSQMVREKLAQYEDK
ncbi:GatB/YqeY domain-containing protein, partial [bacterium]|nr:GatB/YqeY domain-containing protein [bacterium]